MDKHAEAVRADIDPDAQLDAIFDDARVCAIGEEVFNPVDDTYDVNRDGQRFRDCVTKIIALGYSEELAREYLNTELSYCDAD